MTPEFENIGIKNLLVTEEEVNTARSLPKGSNGRVSYVNVERGRKPFEKLEWFFRNNDAVVLLLRGGMLLLVNQGILIDHDIWQVLPKLLWGGKMHVDKRSFSIVARPRFSEDHQPTISLLKEIARIKGVNKKLYAFKNPLDYRWRSLTSTNINRLSGDGCVGYTLHQSGCWQVNVPSRVKNSSYAGIFNTKLEAQQAYNAVLLKHKQKKPEDNYLFGRVFKKGVLQPMFPKEFYGIDGLLLKEYSVVFKQHEHLIAPVNNSIILAEIESDRT